MLLLALLPVVGTRVVGRCKLAAARPAAAALFSSTLAPAPEQRLSSLAPDLFEELNVLAFDSALPTDLPVKWNPRLRRTAGRCRFFSVNSDARTAEIELSPHVLNSTDRLRTTLAHEMCHAAQWLVDGEAHPPHGDAFQRWARRLEQRVPNVIITTTHSYAVQTRYAYACVACGQTYARHSRMDLRARCCGRCRGSLRLVSEPDAADPKRPPPPFAEFVRREYAPQRRRWPHVSHQRIMLALGRKWRRRPLKARS